MKEVIAHSWNLVWYNHISPFLGNYECREGHQFFFRSLTLKEWTIDQFLQQLSTPEKNLKKKKKSQEEAPQMHFLLSPCEELSFPQPSVSLLLCKVSHAACLLCFSVGLFGVTKKGGGLVTRHPSLCSGAFRPPENWAPCWEQKSSSKWKLIPECNRWLPCIALL